MNTISNDLCQLTTAKKREIIARILQQQAIKPQFFPLSFAQQRLWFVEQIQPGNSSYNILLAIRLQGELSLTYLEKSFQEIVARHEILRTSFITIKGEPQQVIYPHLPLKIAIYDIQELPEEAQEQEIKNLVLQEAKQPFDLAQIPLFRVKILQLNSQEFVLVLVMHHIITDAWSIEILLKELITFYQAFSHQQPENLPTLPIQYADFAVWQRNYLTGKVLENHLDYWRKQIGKNLPELKLPTDYPRPEIPTYEGAKKTLVISQYFTEKIKQLSLQLGSTIFMLLLAAFEILLHYYSQQEEIVIGIDVANRNRAETDKLIGFFVNQLVLRLSVAENPTFQELLQRVKSVTLDAYSHQDLPFDLLVNTFNPTRSLNKSPFFQVKVVLETTHSTSFNLPGLTINSIPIPKLKTQLDLLLRIKETSQVIITNLEYTTDLFAESTITRMMNNWQEILNQVVFNPNVKLSDLLNHLRVADLQQDNQNKVRNKQAFQQKLKTAKRKISTDVEL
ncbi:condensation domain-containing protein (plasmid) [Nostoc sp. NIES-3756]|uniref:condensation domain-containing protein n=1 Tax=Nostoc sp. NIES-3756 TaxID=1751286 RepID=UPI000722C6F4|nr:condensation domain-containing protein [Nostoc sp. NIES-3756]BAT56840.1 condensation domain-containing protein [Nostoc sp. NIES-3756]